MGIFNNKGLAQSLVAKMQEKKAMQAAVKGNPNATAKDYLQAGMSSFSMMAAKAKAAQAAVTPGGNVAAQNPSSRMGLAAAIKAAQANSIRNQTQSGTFSQGGFARMANNLVAARGAATISPMQPTPISPTAFSNPDAISGVFGQANEGTFTRTVGDTPLMQMADPGYMPMDDASMAGADMALDEYGQAQMPPMEVETPITPTYDLNNL